jgi:hypothetical protein
MPRNSNAAASVIAFIQRNSESDYRSLLRKDLDRFPSRPHYSHPGLDYKRKEIPPVEEELPALVERARARPGPPRFRSRAVRPCNW